jgi:hypothetical protein
MIAEQRDGVLRVELESGDVPSNGRIKPEEIAKVRAAIATAHSQGITEAVVAIGTLDVLTAWYARRQNASPAAPAGMTIDSMIAALQRLKDDRGVPGDASLALLQVSVPSHRVALVAMTAEPGCYSLHEFNTRGVIVGEPIL